LQDSEADGFFPGGTGGLMGIKLPSGLREGLLNCGMDRVDSHDSDGDMGEGGGLSAVSNADPFTTFFDFGNGLPFVDSSFS
jgi:hypothetical protein